MNKEAFEAVTAALQLYLAANGWLELGPDTWSEPKGRRGRDLNFGHAVNSQLYADRNHIEIVPETPEQHRARWLIILRSYFRNRHVQHPGRALFASRQRARQDVRTWIRILARTTPAETRVQKARLKRAEHARHHKATGCECGKEGPPY